jgi:hypothetical protein
LQEHHPLKDVLRGCGVAAEQRGDREYPSLK